VSCGATVELRLTGDWLAQRTGLRAPGAEQRVLTVAATATRLRIDASGLGEWDSALVVFLRRLREAVKSAGDAGHQIALDDTGLPEAVRRLLSLAAEGEGAVAPAVDASRAPLLVRIGGRSTGAWRQLVAVFALVGETALHIGPGVTGRLRTRAGDTLELIRQAGVDALGIVTIVNALVGGILAFVGAVQLRRFGAEIFVADLVGVAVVREMAAIVTAIVMAGRTGGAYAAHIATMQGNEEIDALRTLGIPVHEYLVMPRVAALVAMMPFLYLYACAVSLLGGLLVAVASLDLSFAAYVEETRRAILAKQFVIGLTKSVVFGMLIALAGCHIGLRAGRSAADVGQAATRAVVVGIIGIIALDAVFAVCINALRI
jgi:phospholipid/cholesterol/gamma-HCH transport system permease protein